MHEASLVFGVPAPARMLLGSEALPPLPPRFRRRSRQSIKIKRHGRYLNPLGPWPKRSSLKSLSQNGYGAPRSSLSRAPRSLPRSLPRSVFAQQFAQKFAQNGPGSGPGSFSRGSTGSSLRNRFARAYPCPHAGMSPACRMMHTFMHEIILLSSRAFLKAPFRLV